MSKEYRHVELLTGDVRRRRWTTEQKLTIIEQSFEPGETVSSAARRHGVAPNLLYRWRRLLSGGLNRERRAADQPVVNAKRVHRIMGNHAMLLEKRTAVRKGRIHDGKVMVMRSNLRWCSDGLEFTCWNGEIIRLAFIIDAFDREIIA